MNSDMKFNIGHYEIGTNHTFVIAEIGNNHNGSVERAKKLIDLASDVGADCVKFQMRNIEHVYRKKTLDNSGDDLGTEYVLDLLRRFELTAQEHKEVFEYCQSKDLLYLCTPWDFKSIELLESFGVPAYKVASADLTNLPLIERLVQTGKPLILSTGMSSEIEIRTTVDLLQGHNAKFVLLHCNSTYPAPLQDINLSWLSSLSQIHPLVGYSGHERGIAVSLAAVALGAKVVERHFTLDRFMEGPDHAASLEAHEFSELVKGIREIELALGDETEKKLSQGEMINRENLGKSLIASKALKKGHIITVEDIAVRSPGQGLSPQQYKDLLGKTLCRDIDIEDYFYESDITEDIISPQNYSFTRPWGIPVRYHDFKQYHSMIQPDLFEFHLSYSDMELDISAFLQGPYKCDFVVHAPELFSKSRLMDLASQSEAYRIASVHETQRVIDITRALKAYFPKSKRPLIVANVGGFSMDEQIEKSKRQKYYTTFAKSLSQLDMAGVELIPQTMAPFPWHFGGQRFQNLFVDVDEIVDWCKKLELRMCFDISHSRLACNHFGYDFYEFSRKIAPITAHLHLGDAKGVNGEGLQIGEGDIDFVQLGEILKEGCPEASFIPEIWQGHKNSGEGFWVALNKLNGIV
ncbi:N-acetylneuraminate synthase family protein [Catenovulum sediminis]|uniref:N-acetylneuraminate synthase family protein n=1 Tax=Catenovulum sediminis TaxID=1740262 RepID=A0ABV1RGV4_9ALTE